MISKIGKSNSLTMINTGGVAVPLVKNKGKGQMTLPAKIRERHGLDVGDHVEVQEEGNRVILIPRQIAPLHPEIDAALAEALEDARTGRVTPAFANMKEYKAWRKTPEGKKFAKS